MSKTAIILQARMGSSRLPGKVLKDLCGKPMLQWIVERLRGTGLDLVVATSMASAESPIVDLCGRLGVPVFLGDETDVLDRYYRCAKKHAFDVVVRATGDNPFVDAQECVRLVALREKQGLDYVSAFPSFGSGLPLGAGLEVFTFAALERSWREGKAPHHREHVNEYMQETPALFKQAVLKAPAEKTAPDLSLTVDTPEQFADAERLYAEYQREHPGVSPPVAWAIAASRKAA